MKKYFEFIGSIPKTPGFKQVLPGLIILQILIGIFNSSPKLIVITFLLSLFFGGFWVQYLSNAIKCEENAFPCFKNNVIKFISMGFRFSFVNLLFIAPFIILAAVTIGIGVGAARIDFVSGDIPTLISKIILFTAISLLWICLAFYIFPLVAMRFAVTKSILKTLNIKRMYVLWHKSKSIYKKMFNDIIVVSTIFFLIGLAVMILPGIFISGLIGTMIMNKANPLASIATLGGSLGMGLVLVIALYIAISLVAIFSTLAIYKIIATYYRIPPKTSSQEVAEVS